MHCAANDRCIRLAGVHRTTPFPWVCNVVSLAAPTLAHTDPLAESGTKGADGMRVMALAPKKMTSFDWNASCHLPGVRAQRTFVVVRFEPVGDRATRVKRTTPRGAAAASRTRPTLTSIVPAATRSRT
jgi:hypothetical protein